MRASTRATDPLWQCLCPAWTPHRLIRASKCLATAGKSRLQAQSSESRLALCSKQQRDYNQPPSQARVDAASRHFDAVKSVKVIRDLGQETTPYLYTRLRRLAIDADVQQCRLVAEHLLRERREKPSVQMYNALIASNSHHLDGEAWRASELLEEMRAEGLSPDVGTCNAVLKVLAVHPDHLLRADVLEYMKSRWFQLDEEAAHDVAAGLLREGLYEQAMERLDNMRREGMRVQPWLLDMAVYVLCASREVEEAYRIMRARNDSGELNISRNVWYTLLDAASSLHHHAGTSFVWNNHVGTDYLNPSRGISLNVITTAAQSGDAVLATDAFTHLAKQGATLKPIHYQMLIDCYLSTSPPDLKRAISILTIMPLEKLEPSPTETRSLYVYLRDKPALVGEALAHLRELHEQGRKVPIAVLNLLIECYVQQSNLAEALKLYKLIHTFVPVSEGTKKTFANIDTFNLLLRGCRRADPPNESLASFLVSELLALRVKPTALTYDRLILVFVEAGEHAWHNAGARSSPSESQRAKGLEVLDWAFRHFADMQAITDRRAGGLPSSGWVPRFGTLERLAIALARVGDERCWDVLQAGEDKHQAVEGWEAKGKWTRRNVEEAWEKAVTRTGNNSAGREHANGTDAHKSVEAAAA